MDERSWVDRVLDPDEYVPLTVSETTDIAAPSVARYCTGCGTRMSRYHPEHVTLCYPCQDHLFETADLTQPMSAAKTIAKTWTERMADRKAQRARIIAAMQELGTFSLHDVAAAVGCRWRLAHPVARDLERAGRIRKTRVSSSRKQHEYEPVEWSWVNDAM